MGRRIEVTPGFCILWALLLLVLPLPFLLAAATAAVIHELAHMLAIRLLGGRILDLTVGAGGMVMETMPMEPWKELLCAVAGPLGSMLAVMLQPWFPWLALCAFVQGCFNLLPLYPLDGGRAAFCVLRMLGMEKLMMPLECLALLVMLLAVPIFGLGWQAAAVWVLLAMRKIPCKARRFAVQ